MQNELRSEHPDKSFQIAAINEHGYDGGNSLMAEDRMTPILQDVDADNNGASDVWTDNWKVDYRDVKVINQQNELVGTINLTPPLGYDLRDQTTYDAFKQIIADVANERPLWQNPADATDVNDDNQTTAVDALQCINELMLGKVSGFNVDLPLPMPPLQPKPFLDVNGDGRITANDAIRVINRLIEQTNPAEGESIATDHLANQAEGESVSVAATDLSQQFALSGTGNVSQASHIRAVQQYESVTNNHRGQRGASDQAPLLPIVTTDESTASRIREDAVDHVFGNDVDLMSVGSISAALA